ncbi:MAG TPA: metal ABC transporter substrate-binding protein [Thermoanaerobaculaceae bacterium]|nr:metal ABC transporter substrate-binding protein [Thermoanaerobaculaceae bacterium]HPS79423.1 metal ABC transporter substrate-binding protein [Thermoanaerobaculaceae bacterium]
MRNSHFVLAVLLAAGLSDPAQAGLRVVTTLQDLASIAQTIGGDRVETFALAKGYQDPHFVDAKPSFILKLSRADLVIVAGLELEIGYLPPLIDQSRNEKIHPGNPGYLDASTGCDVLQRPTQVVTRAMGDVHPYGNPHYWTDPENGRLIARSIAVRLGELDPAGGPIFKRNLAAFEARLTAKEKEWDVAMAPYAGANVITFHESWPNFAKRFKLEIVGTVEPKPGIPPSPSHTLDVINLIGRDHVKVILVEPYFDTKTPDFIAEKTGTTVVMFFPSVGGLPAIRDYFDLFDHNVNAFVDAMKGKGAT